jgi:hypothetical protein
LEGVLAGIVLVVSRALVRHVSEYVPFGPRRKPENDRLVTDARRRSSMPKTKKLNAREAGLFASPANKTVKMSAPHSVT